MKGRGNLASDLNASARVDIRYWSCYNPVMDEAAEIAEVEWIGAQLAKGRKDLFDPRKADLVLTAAAQAEMEQAITPEAEVIEVPACVEEVAHAVGKAALPAPLTDQGNIRRPGFWSELWVDIKTDLWYYLPHAHPKPHRPDHQHPQGRPRQH